VRIGLDTWTGRRFGCVGFRPVFDERTGQTLQPWLIPGWKPRIEDAGAYPKMRIGLTGKTEEGCATGVAPAWARPKPPAGATAGAQPLEIAIERAGELVAVRVRSTDPATRESLTVQASIEGQWLSRGTISLSGAGATSEVRFGPVTAGTQIRVVRLDGTVAASATP